MAAVAVEIVNQAPMWQFLHAPLIGVASDSCHARLAGVANCLNIFKESVMVSL
jgi:hypothetical protein